MLKRLLLALALVVLAGLAWFFSAGPEYFDARINQVNRDIPLAEPPRKTREFHRALFISDLHADPLLWRRDLSRWQEHGMVDLPRLQAGNVALQVFGSVTKTPADQNYDSNPSNSDVLTWLVIANGQPPATWWSLYQRSLFHARKLEELRAANPDQLRIITSREELDALVAARGQGQKVVGGLLGLEGAHPIEGDLEKLNGLFDAGYRMIGLTHFFDNEVAGSMHGEEKYGLTKLGREVVTRAESLGMVVDLAHASPAAVADVFEIATRPVVVSHGGVKAVCDFNRNLTDEQLLKLAENGGVIGIGYWDAAVCDDTPAGIVSAMNHVRDLVGIEHIALGSDFDGAVSTRFDTSELVLVTQALLDAGYSDAEIRAVMGGNVLRVLRATLP